ncbi:hypothetical protein PF003_g4963 [Phytophthora fragariae]|nr:hypothetical protein PF003_g4963 [Phytophthora fragariae]
MLAAGGGDAVLLPLPPLLAGLGWYTQNETITQSVGEPMGMPARTATTAPCVPAPAWLRLPSVPMLRGRLVR